MMTTTGAGARIALVTGGARGIGKSIAESFARGGILPVIADIDGAKARETAEGIGETGVDAGYLAADVSDISQIVHMVDSTVSKYGSVDILVNNAGILSTASIHDVTEAEWDRTMAVNIKSAVFASQAALKHMTRRKWGRIINIASIAGRMGGYSTGCAYTASKAAMIGLTMRLARRVAKEGITVNAIAPGTTRTDMVAGFSGEEYKRLEEQFLMGKLVEPKSVGETAAFLASDGAEFITGAVIDVNGGMFMG